LREIMARQRQHITYIDPQGVGIVLRLLTTRGIGERVIDRILLDVFSRGDGLISLMTLSAQELAIRYKIKIELAESFLACNDLAERLSHELMNRGVVVLLKGMPDYPLHLSNALGAQAPPVLFAQGNLDLFQMPAVGFCGSRKASHKGLAVAAECASILASKGINVISGYASGVDLVAHRSSLEVGGVTTIVLAEGILCFKAKSDVKNLLRDENHLVVSTYSPRLPWSAHQAMARNRIINGLSNAMIVIESGDKGGTFEAGIAALELRRPLFVVEYAQPAPSASGNKYFLERGATPLRRDCSRQANMAGLLKAVQQQKESGNSSKPETRTLFTNIPTAKMDDKKVQKKAPEIFVSRDLLSMQAKGTDKKSIFVEDKVK